MLIRRPTYRRFEYDPRFYKPEQDRAEELKKKLRQERDRNRRKRKPMLFWAVLMVLLFYAYLYLSGSLR